MTGQERALDELIRVIQELGYPREFGALIGSGLGTENAMDRMVAYLRSARPGSAEEIADEMLAIRSDLDRWQEKKINEFYNRKAVMRNWDRNGIDPDEEDE